MHDATNPPVSPDGPSLTIRKFKKDPLTIIDLINSKIGDQNVNEQISNAIDSVKPFMISIDLPVSRWDEGSKQQTVNASGVLGDEMYQLIIPSPASLNRDAYYDAGITCVQQLSDSLVFEAKTIPTTDLTVLVTIINVTQPQN